MRFRGVFGGWKSRASLLAIMTATALAVSPVQAADAKAPIDIPAQSLTAALESLATQSHAQMLYSTDLVQGLKGAAVKGDYTAQEALTKLLQDSGLEAHPTGDGNFTIVKAVAATRLGTVLVTAPHDNQNYLASSATVGGKVPVALREIPNSVSVITRERMDDQNLADVDHALAWATGVDTRPNDGATQSSFYSRGFVLAAMFDGIPSFNGLGGYQQFDLAMYDRIEVLRGPSGLMQGSSEPAGSVNIVRKRPTDKFAASMTASIGSWNNFRETADVSGPLTSDGTVKGRFVMAKTDRDYFYDEGFSNNILGYGIVEYTPTPDWTFSYSSAHQDNRSRPFNGLPTYSDGQPVAFDRTAYTNAPWSLMHWTTSEQKADAEHRFTNGWVAKVAGSYRFQEQRWKDGYPGSVNLTNNTASYTLRDQDYQHYRKAADAFVSGPFKLFGQEHNLLAGTNLDIFNYAGDYSPNRTVTGVSVFNPAVIPEPNMAHTNGTEQRTTQFGQYGQLRLRVADPLLLIVGGRNTSFDTDKRSMTNSNWANWTQSAKAKNEFTPFGGAVVDVTKQTSLYGSYSEIFVPQTQMTYDGTVLPPRTGWQAETGIKNEFLGGKLNATLAAFVLRDINRSLADPAHSGYFTPAGEVESKGWETEISGSPIEGLKLTGGYTYLTQQFINNGATTGNTMSSWEPRHSLKLWGVYSLTDGPLEGFSFGSGIIAKSQTYYTVHQNAYAVLDMQVGYKLNDNLSTSFTINNVFDNTYWAATNNTIYGEPRSFTLALKATM